jgi:hypothetical protein
MSSFENSSADKNEIEIADEVINSAEFDSDEKEIDEKYTYLLDLYGDEPDEEHFHHRPRKFPKLRD